MKNQAGSAPTPSPELVQEARAAHLRYSSDESPGLSRLRRGGDFVYQDAKGKQICAAETLRRIRALVIPPAWEKVWISPFENGHIQATGRDARGRKQYRYHARWREHRDGTKFEHMLLFAKALPKIRRQVKRDLRRPGMPREKILATIVQLLETTVIRVGNDEYARTNHSYGLTTLRNRHVKVKKADIVFAFRGKSGKEHEITLHDARLAKIIRRCQDMPGQTLFTYLAEGQARHIDSQDVNDYLRAATQSDFTAKDFRTWVGTVLAATAFREFEAVTSETQAKKNVGTVIKSVAEVLGNTPTVCRKCYVHPDVLHAYLDGETIATLQQKISEDLRSSINRLRPAEAAVLALLQRRLQHAAGKKRSRGARL